MGTPAFALPTFKALNESAHEVVAVYSQPPRPAGRGQKLTPSPVHAYADEQGIQVFTPTSLKSEEEQKTFADHKADIAVVIAYGLLLPKSILEAYPMGCINVHPSDLPRWRGAAPLQRTIMAGDKETAICIMQMDEGLDTGDVLLREEIDLYDEPNAGTLHDRFADQAGPMVLQTLDGLENGSITPQKQSDEGITYAKKITKEECRINWNKPAEEIYHLIRGLSPAPGAYFLCNGEKIKVFDSELMCKTDKEFTNRKPGEILSGTLDIKCGSGVICLHELQRPGKKRMRSNEFLQGFNIPQSSILE